MSETDWTVSINEETEVDTVRLSFAELTESGVVGYATNIPASEAFKIGSKLIDLAAVIENPPPCEEGCEACDDEP